MRFTKEQIDEMINKKDIGFTNRKVIIDLTTYQSKIQKNIIEYLINEERLYDKVLSEIKEQLRKDLLPKIETIYDIQKEWKEYKNIYNMSVDEGRIRAEISAWYSMRISQLEKQIEELKNGPIENITVAGTKS